MRSFMRTPADDLRNELRMIKECLKLGATTVKNLKVAMGGIKENMRDDQKRMLEIKKDLKRYRKAKK